jgi:hypothetical protein
MGEMEESRKGDQNEERRVSWGSQKSKKEEDVQGCAGGRRLSDGGKLQACSSACEDPSDWST